MNRRIKEFSITSVMGLIGLFIGAALDMSGFIGIILSIATMGTFIISAIEGNQHTKDG